MEPGLSHPFIYGYQHHDWGEPGMRHRPSPWRRSLPQSHAALMRRVVDGKTQVAVGFLHE